MTEELKKALLYLRLEVDELIASDMEARIIRAIAEAREEGREAGIEEMEVALCGFCAAGIAKREAERLKEQP